MFRGAPSLRRPPTVLTVDAFVLPRLSDLDVGATRGPDNFKAGKPQSALTNTRVFTFLLMYFFLFETGRKTVGKRTVPLLSIIIIYNSTWSILIQLTKVILLDDSLT